MLIERSRLEKVALFSIIIVAGLSTVLRPSLESDLTLFRVILPFLVVFFYLKRPLYFQIYIVIAFLLWFYSFFISVNSSYHNFDFVFYLYYIILIFFAFFTRYVVDAIGSFGVYKFVHSLFFIFLFLGYLQYFFGGVYPNTQNRLPMVSIFFWNENEYSIVLSAFFLIWFLYQPNFYYRLFVFILVFYLVWFNGARLALGGITVFIMAFYFLSFKVFRARLLWAFVCFAIFISFLIGFRDTVILDNNSIDDLVFYPIRHIISLDPVENIGSINNRLNAIIFGTIELVDSWFFGIGPGNSILMMTNNIVPGSEEWSAYSMHNFLYQTVVELGIVGIALLSYLAWYVYKNVRYNIPFGLPIVILFYLCMSLILSMSSGPHSNYFFMFIFFYSIYFFRDNLGYKVKI